MPPIQVRTFSLAITFAFHKLFVVPPPPSSFHSVSQVQPKYASPISVSKRNDSFDIVRFVIVALNTVQYTIRIKELAINRAGDQFWEVDRAGDKGRAIIF